MKKVICRQCQKMLTQDEVGLYKKLIDIKAEDYLCIACLANYYGCTVEFLNDKIKQFKKIGCFLFKYKKE